MDRDPVSLLPPAPERTLSPRVWLVAAGVVLLALAIALLTTRRHATVDAAQPRQPDAYAAHLPISAVSMSEATDGTGGKATYVEGTVTNTGDRTLTGAAVQVSFATTDGTAPHRETLPLAVVRTREPYVDLQPLAAAPLVPGAAREFRLIFETVPANWDVMPPTIQIVTTQLK